MGFFKLFTGFYGFFQLNFSLLIFSILFDNSQPCTVGEYSGYKYVVSSDKSIEYHYALDYLVDGQDVVLTIREELRNDDDTSLLEPLLLDVVHNLKIELIGE